MRGHFLLEFETNILINWPKINYAKFPLQVSVLLKSLSGRMRFCFIPVLKNGSWFSFIGEPSISIEINPVVGK